MKKITVEIISDVMCPWCWIGKRNLEKAIDSVGDKYEVSVKWLPFLLRPDTPKEGVAKVINSSQNPRVGSHMRQMGLNAGIDFTGKCDITPSTVMSHNLLRFAGENAGHKVQNDIQEALFHAYFTDGNVLGIDFLLKVAVEAGLNAEQVRAYIESEEANEKTRYEADLHSRKGVQGVPFCIVNGQPMFSGAQPEGAFLRAFSEAPEIS
jgi:predicted DsbA family dithiol-disulfide isomerase